MKQNMYAAAVLIVVLLISGCSETKEASGQNTAGIQQAGIPAGTAVQVRMISPEDFSVYLKYPSTVYSQSESTAYAFTSDVVRNISVTVGDQVEQDQVVLSLSPDNQAYRQAAVAWENAKSAYERNRILFANGDISRQNFDSIATQYELARANFTAARDMVYIKAPISGTITQLNVHPSANVNPGTPLFTVSGKNGYEARFYVGADEIERVRPGARVFIDDGRMLSIEGRITQISLAMDGTKQAFPVTASFDMNSRKLASGMGVDIAVETYRNEKAIVVSKGELTRTEEGYQAYVSQGRETAPVPVELGHVQGLKYEVIQGLEYGDLLVCEGSQNLASAGTQTSGLAMAKAK
ncbi:efflux RND transporter periplasmic adaptor subunit [Breznakiella homolactica]|uniref:Efflux RND transporter periplasmic adaptor subunit n=1 Tax=Breznakiella homolactica TaxID=2798577 RepID=A0A7T7XLK4_9SPIR|nr:efflux RND transporter periplasmic adaptor subunit [Breznakiella homolactica]QQO08517.1 efflux RND transporter periplasmic adaptor subunit [Breznakiella homolactica]